MSYYNPNRNGGYFNGQNRYNNPSGYNQYHNNAMRRGVTKARPKSVPNYLPSKYLSVGSAVIQHIAQLLLAVMLLPLAVWFFMEIAPDDLTAFIVNLFDDFPLVRFAYFTVGGETALDLSVPENIIVTDLYLAFFEDIFVSMCVFLFTNIGSLLFLRGIPALQTFIGTLAGMAILAVCPREYEVWLLVVGTIGVFAFSVIINLFTPKMTFQKVLDIVAGAPLSAALTLYMSVAISYWCFYFNGMIASEDGIIIGIALVLVMLLYWLVYHLVTQTRF